MRLPGVLVICIVLSTTVSAQTVSQKQRTSIQNSDRVVVYAIGSASCGVWLEARESAKKNKNDIRQLQFESFFLGFASAYNWYVSESLAKGILGDSDAQGLWDYFDQYCRDNPTHFFAKAASEVLNHLSSPTK